MRIIPHYILEIAAAVVLAAARAHAQEIDTLAGSSGPGFNAGFADGDLVLAFFSNSDASQSSGTNSYGDLLFNLGPASNFTGLAAGTYSVAAFNGSTASGQPSVGSGNTELSTSMTIPSSSTYWTVMGSNQTTDQLWLAGVTAQSPESASVQNTIAERIDAIGYAGSNIPNADGSAFDAAQTTGTYLNTGVWQNTSAVAVNSVTSTSTQLALYSLLPGTLGRGSSTELGTFALSDDNGVETLTYTAIASGNGPPPSGSNTRLVNISSRAYVGTGADVAIAGFVISGPPGSTEQVLVRGVGPALSQFGVGGALTKPVLTLLDSAGNQLAANTGWTTAANAAEIGSAIKDTGAFAFPSGSADSAILVDLPPGAYTAEIAGANGTTGVALAEVYNVSSDSAELINISTRALVGTGSNVEIGGFVVSGPQPKTVLIRAIGPALGQFGVAGPLAEPSLSVVDSSGNAVGENIGWSSNADAAMIASETEATGAFALPSGSADCALLLTLSPGAYTAIVSGVNGATGVALVEVYQTQ